MTGTVPDCTGWDSNVLIVQYCVVLYALSVNRNGDCTLLCTNVAEKLNSSRISFEGGATTGTAFFSREAEGEAPMKESFPASLSQQLSFDSS